MMLIQKRFVVNEMFRFRDHFLVRCSIQLGLLAVISSVLGLRPHPLHVGRRHSVSLSARAQNIDYEFIHNQQRFTELCHKLLDTPTLALDIECEFNRYRYGEHLCLLQLSDGKDIYIVDPTTVKNLDPLWTILEAPDIEIICHDPSSDFRLLNKLYGICPRNFFDTELAARLIGYPQSSLSYFLEENFGEKKQKKISKSNWFQRPLTNEMLHYAALDVAYLHILKEMFAAELEEKNRLDWHTEDCLALEEIRHEVNESPHLCIRGSQKLNDRELHMLKHLYDVRDSVAQEIDKPAYYIMSNQILLELATMPPTKLHSWKTMPGVHPRVRKIHVARRFHQAVLDAQRSTPDPNAASSEDELHRKGTLTKNQKLKILDQIRAQIQIDYPDVYSIILSATQANRIVKGLESFGNLTDWRRKIVLDTARKLDQDVAFLLHD